MIDACDPDADLSTLQKLIKLNTGENIKLTKTEICQVYKNIQDEKLPLPPLVLNRQKTYMIDRKSPFSVRDYELLFHSSTKLGEIKKLARKVKLGDIDKKTKADLITAIGKRLRHLKVSEPIKLSSTRPTTRKAKLSNDINSAMNVNEVRNTNESPKNGNKSKESLNNGNNSNESLNNGNNSNERRNNSNESLNIGNNSNGVKFPKESIFKSQPKPNFLKRNDSNEPRSNNRMRFGNIFERNKPKFLKGKVPLGDDTNFIEANTFNKRKIPNGFVFKTSNKGLGYYRNEGSRVPFPGGQGPLPIPNVPGPLPIPNVPKPKPSIFGGLFGSSNAVSGLKSTLNKKLKTLKKLRPDEVNMFVAKVSKPENLDNIFEEARLRDQKRYGEESDRVAKKIRNAKTDEERRAAVAENRRIKQEQGVANVQARKNLNSLKKEERRMTLVGKANAKQALKRDLATLKQLSSSERNSFLSRVRTVENIDDVFTSASQLDQKRYDQKIQNAENKVSQARTEKERTEAKKEKNRLEREQNQEEKKALLKAKKLRNQSVSTKRNNTRAQQSIEQINTNAQSKSTALQARTRNNKIQIAKNSLKRNLSSLKKLSQSERLSYVSRVRTIDNIDDIFSKAQSLDQERYNQQLTNLKQKNSRARTEQERKQIASETSLIQKEKETSQVQATKNLKRMRELERKSKNEERRQNIMNRNRNKRIKNENTVPAPVPIVSEPIVPVTPNVPAPKPFNAKGKFKNAGKKMSSLVGAFNLKRKNTPTPVPEPNVPTPGVTPTVINNNEEIRDKIKQIEGLTKADVTEFVGKWTRSKNNTIFNQARKRGKGRLNGKAKTNERGESKEENNTFNASAELNKQLNTKGKELNKANAKKKIRDGVEFEIKQIKGLTNEDVKEFMTKWNNTKNPFSRTHILNQASKRGKGRLNGKATTKKRGESKEENNTFNASVELNKQLNTKGKELNKATKNKKFRDDVKLQIEKVGGLTKDDVGEFMIKWNKSKNQTSETIWKILNQASKRGKGRLNGKKKTQERAKPKDENDFNASTTINNLNLAPKKNSLMKKAKNEVGRFAGRIGKWDPVIKNAKTNAALTNLEKQMNKKIELRKEIQMSKIGPIKKRGHLEMVMQLKNNVGQRRRIFEEQLVNLSKKGEGNTLKKYIQGLNIPRENKTGYIKRINAPNANLTLIRASANKQVDQNKKNREGAVKGLLNNAIDKAILKKNVRKPTPLGGRAAEKPKPPNAPPPTNPAPRSLKAAVKNMKAQKAMKKRNNKFIQKGISSQAALKAEEKRVKILAKKAEEAAKTQAILKAQKAKAQALKVEKATTSTQKKVQMTRKSNPKKGKK